MAVGALNGLIVVGRGGETTLGTVEVYDPSTDSWSTPPSIATSRAYSSAATVNDTLFTFGGAAGDGMDFITTTEAFTLSPCSSGRSRSFGLANDL